MVSRIRIRVSAPERSAAQHGTARHASFPRDGDRDRVRDRDRDRDEPMLLTNMRRKEPEVTCTTVQ